MYEKLRERERTSWQGHVSNQKRNVCKFKKPSSSVFEANYDTSFYTLNFHLPDHLADDVRWFSAL